MARPGMLALATLSLLAERPMHPYEMFQLMVHRRTDRLMRVRLGTLYHTVERLSADGLIRPLSTERAGNRPERTPYEITAVGRARLTDQVAQLLGHPAEEYPELPYALSEAHNLPRAEVVEQLRRRVAAIDADLAESRRLTDGIDPAVPRRYLIEVVFIEQLRQHERDFVAGLAADIESGALAWGEPEHEPAAPRETTEPETTEPTSQAAPAAADGERSA